MSLPLLAGYLIDSWLLFAMTGQSSDYAVLSHYTAPHFSYISIYTDSSLSMLLTLFSRINYFTSDNCSKLILFSANYTVVTPLVKKVYSIIRGLPKMNST